MYIELRRKYRYTHVEGGIMQREKVIEKWTKVIYTDLKDVFLAGEGVVDEEPHLELARHVRICQSLAEKLWEEVG